MARPRSGKVPRNAIKYLTPRHKEMARHLVLGERQCDVARAFGISQPRMSDISRSPVFIAYMKELEHRREVGTGDMLSRVNKGASEGLKMLLRILTEGTPENQEAKMSTKVRVARDLLDREGSAPRVSRTRTTSQPTGPHLTAKDIEELKRRAKGATKN